MSGPESERRALGVGWALFVLSLALFAAAVGVAVLYLALD